MAKVPPVEEGLNQQGSDATPGGASGPAARVGRAVAAGTLSVGLALTLAACGAASSTGAATKGTGASSAKANVAAARAVIADYLDHPSPFPADAPLSKPLPAGTKIVYIAPKTPTSAAGAEAAAAAAKVLGATIQVVSAGTTASEAQAAAATVLAMKPAAAIVGGMPLSYFGDGLKKLAAAGIKVLSNATAEDTKPFGVTFNYRGAASFALAGRLMADWVIVNKGASAKTVFYGIPAIDFSTAMQTGYEQELHKNCTSCSVRSVQINVATLGTTAPQTVVSDLQSHPDTNVAVFVTDEIAAGLPAALSSSGITGITTIGYAPSPQQLEYIKDGQMTAGLGLDVPTTNWTMMDAVARLILGDSPTDLENAGSAPTKFLTKENLASADVTKGWVAYPDYAERFAKVWHPAQ